MGKPAARISDMHVCPKVEPGPVPHVGGPIATGSKDVLTGGLPAARVGDTAICIGPPDKVSTGSSGVFINGKAAARLGDSSAHGGKIVVGCPTVLIGGGAAGGGTVGSTLGEPAKALESFNNIAKTRASGRTQQSTSNCGIEASRQLMEASGVQTTEADVLQDALDAGLATNNPDPGLRGPTTATQRKEILKRNNVDSHLEEQSPEKIQQAVTDGKGVVTRHDPGLLWENQNYLGMGHAVVVTGVVYDETGAVTGYVVNDTGNGKGMKEIPAATFEGSLKPSGHMNVSDSPIW